MRHSSFNKLCALIAEPDTAARYGEYLREMFCLCLQCEQMRVFVLRYASQLAKTRECRESSSL